SLSGVQKVCRGRKRVGRPTSATHGREQRALLAAYRPNVEAQLAEHAAEGALREEAEVGREWVEAVVEPAHEQLERGQAAVSPRRGRAPRRPGSARTPRCEEAAGCPIPARAPTARRHSGSPWRGIMPPSPPKDIRE